MYIVRLTKNAIKYLQTYGVSAAFGKSLTVVKRWFVGVALSPDITNESYQNWLNSKVNEEPVRPLSEDLPMISVLMPVYFGGLSDQEVSSLEEAIQCIIGQTYANWELCMVDDASPNGQIREVLRKYAENDPRIKVQFSETNNHISMTTNTAFDMSAGEFVLLMDNDDLMPNYAFAELIKVVAEYPDADLIYYDEDKLSLEGERIEPFFKPDPSPEFLLSMMYPTHALYSRSIFEKAGKMRKGYEGSQDYDLCLRVFDLTDKIYHIPKILYHWRKIAGSTADTTDSKPYVIDSARKSIKESFERRGYKADISGDNYPFRAGIEIKDEPSIEIIIPTRDKVDFLKKCISSILDKSSFGNYLIHIVDNNSVEPATLKYFKKIEGRGVKVSKYDNPFNYSAINNWASSLSTADYLLFLNNDTEVIEPRWIEEMLMWAQMEKAGAVGAKLLFPDFTVQHAGIIMGLGPDVYDGHRPVAAHAFYKEREGSPRAFNQMNLVRNYSAVTGACLMINRVKFNEVGGFDEENLAVNYNDVDLCLKLLEAGYRNVYTAHARLFHYESASRVKEPPREETEYVRKRWKKYIDNDPYYNPNFARNTVHSFVLPD